MTAAELAALPEALAERAYAEWANVTCVDDCQAKYVEIIAAAIKEAMQAQRKRDIEMVSAMLAACDAGDFGDKEYSRAYVEGVIETISAAAIEREPPP